jgi:hypothetical protein
MNLLESRIEKLENRSPPRDHLIVYIVGGDGYAEKYAEAERQAKEQGRELLVYYRVYV